MTTRRPWIAGLVLGLLGVALAGVGVNSRSERPDVQILLMGYTTWPAQIEGCAQDFHARSGLVRKPILLATNCGSVPVQVLSICDPRVRTNGAAHLRSYLRMRSFALKPGESAKAEFIPLGRDGQIYRAELAYYRLDLWRRLSQRARSSTNFAARVVSRLLPRPGKPLWARSEPITNSITYRSRAQITASPPPVADDLLLTPQFH